MRAIRYTQKNGFEPVEDVEAELGIQLPESWTSIGDVLKAAGWAEYSFPFSEYGVRDWLHIGTYDGKDGKYLVELTEGDRSEWILVDGAHNLMAFKLAASPLIQVGLLEQILERGTAAEVRAFIHKHGHNPLWPCHGCETSDETKEREGREQRRRDRKRTTQEGA